MNESLKIKKIVGLGLLTALLMVFQFIGNYIAIGPVNINLSLVIIAIGAIVYGPLSGLFLGLINGVITIISPSTLALFMPVSPVGTILICLLKTGLAGLLAGLIYKLFEKIKKPKIGAVFAGFLVPIVNTLIFAGGSLIFFQPLLNQSINANMPNAFMVLILGFIGVNFFVEIGVTTLLTPVVLLVIKLFANRKNK